MKLPPCGENPALKAISDAKTAINNQLTAGKSALASLETQLTSLKAKVLAAVPKIPVLDSFQAELAGLIGASPYKIAAFSAKWNGKVEGLDALVAKVTGSISDIASLDFCQDVPNVKMDPVTKEVKTEPPEPTPPTKAPVAPQPVTPTVVDKAKEPVKPEASTITPEITGEYNTKFDSVYYRTVVVPLDNRKLELATQLPTIEETPEWRSANKKADKEFSQIGLMMGSGKLTAAEEAVAKRYFSVVDQVQRINKINCLCNEFRNTCENALADRAVGVGDTSRFFTKDGSAISEDAKDKAKASAPGSDESIERIAALVMEQKDVIIQYRKYKRAVLN